jgi:hypothetical protein
MYFLPFVAFFSSFVEQALGKMSARKLYFQISLEKEKLVKI